MKIETKLNVKAWFSTSYLLIAVGLIWLTFYPTAHFSSLYYLETIAIPTGGPTGYYVRVFNELVILVWAVAIVFLVHFYYGSIYYQAKYADVLKNKFVGFNGDDSSSDYSWGRGIIAGISAGLLLIPSARELSAHLGGTTFLWIGTWTLLIFCLLLLTRTHDLFNRSFVLVDLSTIFPEKYSGAGNQKREYLKIYFDYPVSEAEETWKRLIAEQYIKTTLEDKKREKNELADVTKLSEIILTEITKDKVNT